MTGPNTHERPSSPSGPSCRREVIDEGAPQTLSGLPLVCTSTSRKSPRLLPGPGNWVSESCVLVRAESSKAWKGAI